MYQSQAALLLYAEICMYICYSSVPNKSTQCGLWPTHIVLIPEAPNPYTRLD